MNNSNLNKKSLSKVLDEWGSFMRRTYGSGRSADIMNFIGMAEEYVKGISFSIKKNLGENLNTIVIESVVMAYDQYMKERETNENASPLDIFEKVFVENYKHLPEMDDPEKKMSINGTTKNKNDEDVDFEEAYSNYIISDDDKEIKEENMKILKLFFDYEKIFLSSLEEEYIEDVIMYKKDRNEFFLKHKNILNSEEKRKKFKEKILKILELFAKDYDFLKNNN